MPVTEPHAKIGELLSGVRQQRHALPGVEQHAVAAGIEPLGEAVLAQQSRTAHGNF
jgi:hypothetical protein